MKTRKLTELQKGKGTKIREKNLLTHSNTDSFACFGQMQCTLFSTHQNFLQVIVHKFRWFNEFSSCSVTNWFLIAFFQVFLFRGDSSQPKW